MGSYILTIDVMVLLSPSLGFKLVLWIINCAGGVAALFISLYLLITHDDMKSGTIQPAELADSLAQLLPYEYMISAVYLLIICIQGPWYFLLLTIPLAAYNLSRYNAKDHKLYFITKGEYKPHYKRMEKQFQFKSRYTLSCSELHSCRAS